MSYLPPGWASVPLHEACSKITDGTHHSPRNLASGDFMYVTAKNIRRAGLDLSDISFIDADTHATIYARAPVERGDVLYIKDGATTGIAVENTLDEPFSLLSSVALLKLQKSVLYSRYLMHWLNSPDTLAAMVEQMTGSAIRRLTLSTISRQTLPLPPLAEQRRIVAKLDQVMARTARARTELARIPALIAHHKRAILAAAFAGRQFQPLGELTERIQYGYTAKSSSDPTGSHYLRITDIQDGRVDWGTVPFVAINSADLERYRLEKDDIVFARSGATVGKSFLIVETPADAVFASYLIRVRCDPSQIDPEFAYLFFQSESYWRQILQGATGTGQPNFNGSKLGELLVPKLSLGEQHTVVREMKSALARLDRVPHEHAQATRLLDHLDQALLAKAFRGELVPQDTDDEPAATLLARIRADREGAAPTARKRKARA